tara:strand:- start:262 stop:420 length:159 start_codon:yes stop_codon:yes gene_type:complete
MAEAVPLAGLFKRYQIVFNSAYDLRFPADNPALGAGWWQLSKRVVRGLDGLS